MPETATYLPEGVREGDDRLVRLTASAVTKARALRDREGTGSFLRIAISGGGCNGLSYKLKFVPEARRGDIMVRFEDLLVLVDSKSALYLKGTQLDYSSSWWLVVSSSQIPTPKPAARVVRVSASDAHRRRRWLLARK